MEDDDGANSTNLSELYFQENNVTSCMTFGVGRYDCWRQKSELFSLGVMHTSKFFASWNKVFIQLCWNINYKSDSLVAISIRKLKLYEYTHLPKQSTAIFKGISSYQET